VEGPAYEGPHCQGIRGCDRQDPWKRADFILISGDLFNTSVPEISVLKDVVRKLKELQEKGIPVYVIAGSHDFSPSGKTILEVLEEAGLCRNVVKGKVVDKKLRLEFTTDRTGAKICGMIGRKGMLERSYYENLDKEALEKEEGFKIFMFHTALSELKPKSLEKMESSPVSFLPEGFDYYAGGHVHIVRHSDLPGYRNIVYPGPLFPNNFRSLRS
jgi:DNA repair exonuclease SbcCD nuclease subunit